MTSSLRYANDIIKSSASEQDLSYNIKDKYQTFFYVIYYLFISIFIYAKFSKKTKYSRWKNYVIKNALKN